MSGDRLRELATHFGDHDNMTVAQETFAEQTRETLHYAAIELDVLDRLRAHVRSLHRLNGWSRAKGWWCACGTVITGRSLTRDTAEPRPWSPDRPSAEVQHAFHVDAVVRAEVEPNVAAFTDLRAVRAEATP